MIKDFDKKQWRYQLNILSSIYTLLLTGVEPKANISAIITCGLKSDNPNIQVISFILSGFISYYYPKLFAQELKECLIKGEIWNGIFESLVPFNGDNYKKGSDKANYYSKLNLNPTVVKLLTYTSTIDNFDYNPDFSVNMTICNTIRRICNVMECKIIKPLYDGTNTLFSI